MVDETDKVAAVAAADDNAEVYAQWERRMQPFFKEKGKPAKQNKTKQKVIFFIPYIATSRQLYFSSDIEIRTVPSLFCWKQTTIPFGMGDDWFKIYSYDNW